ncbi:unnamed protein product [[Candida] boidinii]|nr:unnamed protein product [[Candida] boidinii]
MQNNKLQIYKLKYNFEKNYNNHNNNNRDNDNYYEYPKVNELSNIIKYGTIEKLNHHHHHEHHHHEHHHNNPNIKRPIPLYKQLRDLNIGEYESNVNYNNNDKKTINDNSLTHNEDYDIVNNINLKNYISKLSDSSSSSSLINLTLDLTNYNNKINKINKNGKILGKKKYKDKSFIRRNLILILINFLKISTKLFK